MADRVYLDWNASAPLRPEARAAMIAAMDEVGNPSSVHAEGRRAKAIVERARAQVSALVGCDTSEVVFTSGATEAAEQALSCEVWNRGGKPSIEGIPLPLVVRPSGKKVKIPLVAAEIEHDCVDVHVSNSDGMSVFRNGQISWQKIAPAIADLNKSFSHVVVAIQAANSETGVVQRIGKFVEALGDNFLHSKFSDLVQVLGKIPVNFSDMGLHDGCISGHKIGATVGVGALIVKSGPWKSASPLIYGGGQEQNRRAGTENVIGIAGFGAAAEAAQRDLDNGEWDRVKEMRDEMEARLRDAAPDLIVFGETAPRLPNTSCFAIPGWKGETQVMQMDLAGYAISAGSACSSGKVNKASRVLTAMGYDEITASSAIRVSMGPTTTEAEITAFADAWIQSYRRWKQRAA